MSSWRIMATGLLLVACTCFASLNQSYAQSRTHLYVLLGFLDNSPGLSEFGARMQRLGVPTTVRNYIYEPALAQEAIQQYKSGKLRSIMIVGHSLGGTAAISMAAELGRSGVPVQLVVTLDPTFGAGTSSNVRRSVNFRPTGGQDHFTVIAAHARDLRNLVLGSRGAQP